MPGSQSDVDRAVLACSVWLHAGYVGAVVVAAGLIQLFVSEASLPLALLLVFSGGLLAVACWRRAQAVLEHAERASPVATDAASASVPRTALPRTGRGAVVALSQLPRQANRRLDERRRATSE
jgi:hypothetical protein